MRNTRGLRSSSAASPSVSATRSTSRAISARATRRVDALVVEMQLRYLRTLTQIAGDKSSTIVFPVPLDIPASLLGRSATIAA